MGLSHDARTHLAAPSHDPRRAMAVPHSPEKVFGAAGTGCILPCDRFAKGHLHFCVIHAGGMGPAIATTSLSPGAHLNFLWLLSPQGEAGSDPAPGHRLCFPHGCCCPLSVCGHLTPSLRRAGVRAFVGRGK